VFDDLAGLILQLNDTLTWFLFQLKSGLTSAPRLPHARQIRRGSISHSLTSSGHWLILIAIERLQTSTRRTQLSRISTKVIFRGRSATDMPE
jgi:hypothetical protein